MRYGAWVSGCGAVTGVALCVAGAGAAFHLTRRAAPPPEARGGSSLGPDPFPFAGSPESTERVPMRVVVRSYAGRTAFAIPEGTDCAATLYVSRYEGGVLGCSVDVTCAGHVVNPVGTHAACERRGATIFAEDLVDSSGDGDPLLTLDEASGTISMLDRGIAPFSLEGTLARDTAPR
jgi:hypothetical protein